MRISGQDDDLIRGYSSDVIYVSDLKEIVYSVNIWSFSKALSNISQ